MKVCFVVPSLAGGGAERVAVLVLGALPARFDRVLYLFSGEGVYFDQVAPGVRVVVSGARSWPGRLRALAAHIRRERPDVVMPFLSYFVTYLAARLAGTGARVVFNQGTPTTGFLDDPDFAWRGGWRRRVFEAMTRLLYPRADAVVVTSAGVGEDLAETYGVPRARLRVLHNPVDVDAVGRLAGEPVDDAFAPGSAPTLVAAGRLAGVKNYPLLLDALSCLPERRARLWILGDGEERAALEARTAELGLENRVTFLGFQANPWRFIARADVFVLTSRYEGFGNVLVEAMACGVPVVATRSSGTEEVVDDGRNGLLVAHEPSAIAAAIARILGEPGLAGRLAGGARADLERYALPGVAERYGRLFDEVTA